MSTVWLRCIGQWSRKIVLMKKEAKNLALGKTWLTREIFQEVDVL